MDRAIQEEAGRWQEVIIHAYVALSTETSFHRLLVLLGLDLFDLFPVRHSRLGLVPHRLSHTFLYLSILVDTAVVDAVDPTLCQSTSASTSGPGMLTW